MFDLQCSLWPPSSGHFVLVGVIALVVGVGGHRVGCFLLLVPSRCLLLPLTSFSLVVGFFMLAVGGCWRLSCWLSESPTRFLAVRKNANKIQTSKMFGC